jgi:hypothetical protein
LIIFLINHPEALHLKTNHFTALTGAGCLDENSTQTESFRLGDRQQQPILHFLASTIFREE